MRAVAANLQDIPVDAGLTGTVGGHTIEFRRATISGRGFHLFRGSATIENPRLWSPADPHLYTVELAAEHGDGVVQQYTQRTGIRSIEVDDRGRMLLNGKHLALRGASMHEEDPTRGAALRPGGDPRELRPAARPGRHHDALALPAAPARARAGGPLRHRGLVRGPGLPDARRAVPAAPPCAARALDMVRDMVNRDRSHPSVIVWSLGNENTSKPGVGFTRYLREAATAHAAARPDAARRPGVPRLSRRSASRRSTRASTRSG